MRSKALIFSGSAWVISARRWSAAITTPSMTRWSKPRRSNCFHAVLLQSTASCSRTRAKWQRVVEQSVNSKSSSIANAVAQVYIPELTQYVDDPSSLEWAVVRPQHHVRRVVPIKASKRSAAECLFRRTPPKPSLLPPGPPDLLDQFAMPSGEPSRTHHSRHTAHDTNT